MMSSYRVLKRETVQLDPDNKIVIETTPPAPPEEMREPPPSMLTEEDAQNSAKRIVRNAERQAEQIVSDAVNAATQKQNAIEADAQAKAEKILSDAKEKGYRDGMEKAQAEGEMIRDEAQQVLDDANAERVRMQESLEPEIVEMVIKITENLLGDIIKVHPKAITNLVKQGFSVATISGEVTVYASPDDFDTLEENKDELLALTDGSVKLQIKKDLSLSPFDCVIETPFGDIDCSLGQQFEALKANLTYILNNK